MTPEDELAGMLERKRKWDEQDARLEELQQQVRTRQAYAAQRSAAALELAGIDHERAVLGERLAFHVTTRQKLCDELLALPRGRTRPELDLRANIELSIKSIDKGLERIEGARAYTLRSTRLGELMLEADLLSDAEEHQVLHGGLDWRGSSPELEKQIKELTKRREVVAAQFAEASLSDEERAAEQAARAERPTRKTRGDGSQYDVYWKNGVRIDVEVVPS